MVLSSLSFFAGHNLPVLCLTTSLGSVACQWPSLPVAKWTFLGRKSDAMCAVTNNQQQGEATHCASTLVHHHHLQTTQNSSDHSAVGVSQPSMMAHAVRELIVIVNDRLIALLTHHCLVMLLLLPLRLFCPFSFMCVRTFQFAEARIRMRDVSNLRGAHTSNDFVCQRILSNQQAAPPKI